MKKYFVSFTLLLYCVGSIYAAHDLVFPSHWLLGESHAHVIEKGTLQYSTPYIGNVSIPPYVYEYLEGNHNVHKSTVVSSICGSSHDGRWVQAPKKDGVRRAGWYYDGPFLNADIDTLRLPHTISWIGNGAFENGKIKVLIIGADTPPEFESRNEPPAFHAKLIVPTGSIQAYSEHEAWSRFSQIEEGAETYFPAQMSKVNGAWYELYQGEGKLIASDLVRGKLIIPDEISFQSSVFPVTELGSYSVYKYSVETVTLGRNIRSFSIDCFPATQVEFDYWVTKYPILDSINVVADNPYLSSAGGAVYTKDFKELIYLPLDVRRKNGSTKYYTLVNGTTTLRDNSVFCLQTGEGRGDSYITLVLPVPKGIMHFGTGTTANAICYYLVDITPEIIPFGQIPIFNNNITAYWMEDSESYDLQVLDIKHMKEYTLSSNMVYGPMQGCIKTIGKYRLNARDKVLPLRYRWLSIPETYCRMDNKDYLETFTIQDGIEEIYGLFDGCKALKTINLPQSLKILGYQSLYNCKSLEKILLPRNLQVIGTGTFTGCQNLANIYIESTIPPAFYNPGYEDEETVHTYNQVFTGTPSNVTLHVPIGHKQVYINSPVWQEFSNIVDDVQIGIPINGDVNGDNILDAADLLEVMNYIMGNPSAYVNQWNADINGDGIVNIADIIQIINNNSKN